MTIYEKTLRTLYGQICWQWYYEPRLNLWLSFGEPKLEVMPRLLPVRRSLWPRAANLGCKKRVATIKGRWRLWINFGYWAFMCKGTCIARASSSRAAREEAEVLLEGQRLVHVEVNPKHGATVFRFDLGGELRVRRMKVETADSMWSLYEPSGYVLTVRCDGTFNRQPGAPHIDKRPLIIGRSLTDSC
jgi:hypothetical protein